MRVVGVFFGVQKIRLRSKQMPKSLFGKDKNIDIESRYEELSELTENKEKAAVYSKRLSELKKSVRNEDWANEVVAFSKEVKAEAEAFKLVEGGEQLKALDEEANKILTKLASERASAKEKREKEDADFIDKQITKLKNAQKSYQWISDVNNLKEFVGELSEGARKRCKKLDVFNELVSDVDLVIKALNKDAEAQELIRQVNTYKSMFDDELLEFAAKLSPEIKKYMPSSDELSKTVKQVKENKAQASKLAKERAAEAKRKEKEEKEARRAEEERQKKIAQQQAAEEWERTRKQQEQSILEYTQTKDAISDRLKRLKEGASFTFGKYAPKGSSDARPIEWITLSCEKTRTETRFVFITKDIIDTCPFVDFNQIFFKPQINVFDAFRYEHSFVRNWLNSEFVKNAFSLAEKQFLCETEHASLFDEYKKITSRLSGQKSAVTKDVVYLPGAQDFDDKRTKWFFAKNNVAFPTTALKRARAFDVDQQRLSSYLMRDVEIKKGDRYAFILKTMDCNGKKAVVEPLQVYAFFQTGVKEDYKQAKLKEVESVGIRPMITLKLSV